MSSTKSTITVVGFFIKMEYKNYFQGTERIHDPKVTLDHITPYLKTMGITRVANVTGLDDIGIPVIAVYRPNSKSLAVSQGKGHCINAAKVSGIMESIEGYHAENIDLKVIRSSYKALKKRNESIIDIEKITCSSDREFDKETIIRWIECQDITDHKTIWSPHEIINADFTLPMPDDYGYFIGDSNGLASGNTVLEALNHALYEVIERDCLALWQLTPASVQSEKRLNIKTIQDDFLNYYIQTLKNKNIHIAIWNLTNDIGISTFLCKIVSDHNTGIRPAYGSGTHLNKAIALSRAITEAAQSRLTFISGARDDQYQSLYKDEVSETVYQEWINEMSDFNESVSMSYCDIDTKNFRSLEEDRDYILSRLSSIGLDQVVYADLTKPEFNIPVVKVVVPGLEGITYPERRLLGERGIAYFDQYGVGACEIT